MSAPSERTVAKALSALDGMEQVARNEMVTKGTYIDPFPDLDKTDGICGGHRACLIGSLWIGYEGGVPDGFLGLGRGWPSTMLAGDSSYGRHAYMARRPGLRLAYDALNAAALRRIGRDPVVRGAIESELDGDEEPRQGWAEALFELTDWGDRRDVLSLIRSARRDVAKLVPEVVS